MLLVCRAQTVAVAVADAGVVFWGDRWGTPSRTSVPWQRGIKFGTQWKVTQKDGLEERLSR